MRTPGQFSGFTLEQEISVLAWVATSLCVVMTALVLILLVVCV